MHFYEIRSPPLWLQPIFLTKYRTNFAVLAMIHHTWYFSWNAIFLVLVSCAWILFTLVWSGFPNVAFIATIYVCKSVFFSSRSHQNVGTKSKDSRVWWKISIVKHSITNFEVGHTVANSTVVLKLFVKFNCRLKLNVRKCIYAVILLW